MRELSPFSQNRSMTSLWCNSSARLLEARHRSDRRDNISKGMSVPDKSALLVAFARAASKAHEIEALFQDLLIAAEVAQDNDNRSLDQIERQIESETLGRLKG